MDITVVVYNISSVPKMLEFAKLIYGFGIKRLVLAKVFGAAAQQIGDLFKLSFKVGGDVVVLNSIEDTLELLNPDVVYALTRPDGEAKPLSRPNAEHVMLIVHGADLPFSPREIPPRTVLAYAVDRDVGSLGQLAAALLKLLGSCNAENV